MVWAGSCRFRVGSAFDIHPLAGEYTVWYNKCLFHVWHLPGIKVHFILLGKIMFL